MRSTLRAVAKLQPLIARQRKAKKCVLKSVAVNHAIYLLETSVSSGIANSHQTSALRS
ncbi:hypothetical protein [Pilibacter termitis]|uniref:hypothetical protein n=1 Tax=Pilibacter termitis TaxID=263852 RepID=UPI0013562940|nr:hypothetical protein [Pilibacter termitis]